MPFLGVGCSAKLLSGFPQTTLTPFLGNSLVCGYRLFRAHGNKQSAEKHGLRDHRRPHGGSLVLPVSPEARGFPFHPVFLSWWKTLCVMHN